MSILDQFIQYILSEKRLSERTIISYKTDLEQFRVFLLGDSERGLPEAGLRDVRAWVIDLLGVGVSSRSVHRKVSSLRHFYKYCIREGILEINPVSGIKLPRVKKRLPVYVEVDSMRALFEDLAFGDDFEGVRDRLILEILYGSGLRLSELIGLTVRDVDESRHILRVRGKGSKDRLVPYPRPLSPLYQKYLSLRAELQVEEGFGILFLTTKGKKLYPKFVYRLVKRYLSYVTTVAKKSPHVLRHSYATHLLNRGADLNAIKELLGHSSLAATQVYTHTNLSNLKSIMKKAHPRASE